MLACRDNFELQIFICHGLPYHILHAMGDAAPQEIWAIRLLLCANPYFDISETLVEKFLYLLTDLQNFVYRSYKLFEIHKQT